jgi:flagellar motor protein MotB
MRRLKKPLIGIVLLFAIYSLLGFFALPPILKSILTKKLSEALQREVTIEKIQANPYILSLTAHGLKIKERGSSEIFAAGEEIFLNLQALSALRWELILKEVRVRQPFLNLVRKADGFYNFSDLLEKKPSKSEEKGKPFHFSLNNIQVQDGRIDFEDKIPEKKHTVRELNLSIASISNTPQRVEIFVLPLLSAKVNGTPYELRGKTKPFADSLETVFDIEFRDLDLPFYLAYVPIKMNFRVPSAYLDAKAKITFRRSKDKAPSANLEGDLAIKKLAIDDGQGKPVFRLPRFDVSVASAQPFTRIVHLSKIAIQSPELEIRRNRDGSLNFESLFPEKKETKEETKAKDDSTPFTIEIDEISLSGGKVSFSDLSTKDPFKTTLSPIELKILHFSNSKDKKTDYAASLATEAKETVKVEGTFSIDPFQGEGALELKNLPFRKYSPYYRDRILFDIADGTLDLGTRYQHARGEKEMDLSLKELSLSLRSLRLKRKEEKEDFFRIPLLTVQETGLDLSRKEVKVGRVSTEKGMLAVTRLKKGNIDLMDLFPPLPKGKEEKTPPSSPWLFTLVQFAMDQYMVKMKDLSLPNPVTLAAEKIRVRGENISTGKGRKGSLSLSLLLDQRTAISSRSAISIDPLRVDGSAEIKRLPFRPYSPYYQDRILFQVEDGELEAQTRFHFSSSQKGSEIRLSELSSSLLGLKLRKEGELGPFLTIPSASLKGGSLDLTKKEGTIREISTQNGAVKIQRSKSGEINLASLLPPTSEGPPSRPKENPSKDEKPWAFKVGKISLDRYQVTWEDAFPSEPALFSVQDLTLKAENLDTAQGQRANASLAFRLNEKGKVVLDGSVGVNPPGADLKVALKEIAIQPLQPYFSDQAKLVVTDGNLSASGTLSLASQEGTGWQVSYRGEGSIDSFSSIDKIKAEDFLKWESLAVSGMDVGVNPLHVRIDGIALSNFYSRLIIHPDGSLNVQNIMGKGEAQEKAPAPSPPQKEPSGDKTPAAAPGSSIPDIRIARITLQGGEIDFSDNYIKPHYGANLTQVGGRVSDLNAAEMKSGDVELRAMWNKTEPIEITGKVNPVAQDLFVDLNVKLKDIELSPMTPYATKYLGYTIQKGKLAMDLKYLIVQKKLAAENKIFFDQLTLGDRVESPDATKLPVKFGISLLKDRKGEIHLDVPVTGRLDDPKFSVFKIVMQVIGNLLVKAATSPFALISALTGGGEQLEYAEFEYGSSEVKDETAKKLNTVAKALQDRPEIKLDVVGHVDMEKDREALKTLFFQRKIKNQKMKETVKKGQPSVPVDEIKVETEEYERYLKKAYKEEKFPKPKNFLGLEKSIPVPEMEKLMLTHLEVKEEDLRDLASQRSRKVKDFLVQEGKIEPERIFLVEAKSLSPEKKENLKDSRVVFGLK